MEAASLQHVPDSINKGASYLPSAGSSGKIPGGTVGSGPAPTPAPNSGTKLDSSLTAASSAVSSSVSRQYASKEDPGVKGANTVGDSGTTASNEN